MINHSANEIRSKWLGFFKKNQHYVLPSASLIPQNDPSLLWINSGVATLKPYFSGIKKPIANRLTSCQKSIRTNDIENVGVTSRHHTFFEMLGNFSIGDYFKKEAIAMAYDLLINEFKLDLNRLYITVFADDIDAYNYWLDQGISADHITKGNRDRNFWDVGNGPCGPCTEIYYDRGEKYDPKHIGIKLFTDDIENDRYVEIWNIVFSQFNNDGTNHYRELVQKNIDTGAGLERLACVMQDVPTNYDTDLFQPIIQTLQQSTKAFHYDMQAYFSNGINQKWANQHFVVIADHLKACVFAIGDGAVPSAKDRGAVIRKLIRRSLVCAWQLKMDESFLTPAINAIIQTMEEYYPVLVEQKDLIIKTILSEQKLFAHTFANGIKLFDSLKKQKQISGNDIFKLTDTYGFPYEVIKSMCQEQNIHFDEKQYLEAMNVHQNISRNRENIKAMTQQNENLLQFNLDSVFDYENYACENAKVIAIFDEQFNPLNSLSNHKGYLVFDHTVFYATSGGQIHDQGTIRINQQDYPVIDVIKAPNGQHLHLIEPKAKVIKAGELASLKIDQNFRLDVMRNHSCEHLLQKALQTVISSNIYQQGAVKTNQKLTFDFTYANKLTNEDLLKVEQQVNQYIKTNAKVVTHFMSIEEAKKIGAQAHFEQVYAKIKGNLRVVDMLGVTKEVCGGTHVKQLGDIEQFMITKLETKGGGSYRIEAITGNHHIEQYINDQIKKIQDKIAWYQKQIANQKADLNQFNQLVKRLDFSPEINHFHQLVNQLPKIEALYLDLIKKASHDNRNQTINEIKQAFTINDQIVIYHIFNNMDLKAIASVVNGLAKTEPNHTFVAINVINQQISYIVATGKNVSDEKYYAINLVKAINQVCTGFGGGSIYTAQGGTHNIDSLSSIEQLIKNY